MFSPVVMIKSDNFPEAWEKLVRRCMRSGVVINFGGTEEEKIAKDISSITILEGAAISQVLNEELPEGVSFKGKAVSRYKKEYTRKFANEQKNLPVDDIGKHPYTYIGRFIFPIDQLEVVRKGIEFQQKTGIQSNRTQMITWDTSKDSFTSASPPCLQRVWIRWYPGDVLDVQFDWRSRDLYDAWTSNLIGLIWMVNEYIAIPNNCTIGRIVDKCNSLHVYKYNWGKALKV